MDLRPEPRYDGRALRGVMTSTLRAALGRLAVLALTAAASAPARAQAPSPRAPAAPRPRLLVQRSPEASDCPDAEALAARVAGHMGRPALDTTASPTLSSIYDVQIFRTPEGYTAIVRTSGKAGPGARQLTDPGDTCAGLTDALGLTLAILLDSEAPKPRSAPDAPARADAAAAAAGERYSRFALTFGGAATAGLVGAASPAIGGDFEIGAGSRLGLRVGGMWLPPVSLEVPDTASGRIEVSLAAARAGVCVFVLPPIEGELTVAGCAQAALGAIHAEASGFPTNGDASPPWAALGASAFLRGTIAPPLGFSVEAALYAPLTRQGFDIAHLPGTEVEPSAIGGAVGAAVRLSVW